MTLQHPAYSYIKRPYADYRRILRFPLYGRSIERPYADYRRILRFPLYGRSTERPYADYHWNLRRVLRFPAIAIERPYFSL